MSAPLFAATLATALASGLVAGVFYAFSSFVMPALDRLPAGQAVAAMQSINRTAVLAPFMLAFIGTALASVALGVVAVLNWDADWSPWVLGAALLYLLGAFALTAGYHVPLNDGLAAADPHAADAAARWDGYHAGWTLWNHVRAAAALGAAGLLTAALVAG